MLTSEQIAQIERNPSEAQAEAGNYRKGHVRLHGLDISVETPRGALRRGVGADGKPWQVRMGNHYGYIRRTEGADGDHVDVYLGPHRNSRLVYVIDQCDARSGEFDEHKCFLGFASPRQVRKAYEAAFSDGRGRDRMAHIEEMTVPQFKEWLKDGDTKRPILHRAAGGRIPHMADGGALMSDEAMGFGAPGASGSVTVTDADMGMPASEPTGWKSYIPAAFRDIPGEAWDATAEQVKNIGNAWSNMRQRRAEQAKRDREGGSFFDPRGMLGPVQDVGDVGGALLSAASLPVAPIQGAARSLIGHPMADIETTVGTVINPQVAQERAKGKAYEDAKSAVDLAMAAVRPRGHTPRGPDVPATPSPPEAMINQNMADEFGIKLSRGQATQDLDAIRYEDMASRGAYGKEAQDKAAGFFDQQFQDIQNAGRQVGTDLARGAQVLDNPNEAAALANAELAQRAADARRLRDAAEAAATREAEAQRAMVTDRERAIDEAIAGGRPIPETPRDVGEALGESIREGARGHRQEFRGLYDEAFSRPGEFHRSAFEDVGNRMRNRLSYSEDPVIIDDRTTPIANRALADVDQYISQLRIPNRAEPRAAIPREGQVNPDGAVSEIAAVNLKGVDQARKRLVSFYKDARGNAADERAMRRLIDEFDNEIEGALTEGLFSGDPRALDALQAARASYSRYQRLYRPRGAGDDVGAAMRKIVDRNATPEEIVNLVIGSGKIGRAGTPVRIADRLEDIFGAGSGEWNAIRQAMWQKASRVPNATGIIDPAKSAANILDFTNSTLGRRMFSPQELAAMRSHAQGVRDLDRVIENLPATQRAERARSIYQQAFEGEGISGQAFKRIMDGSAVPEETVQAVFNVIGGTNPGNVVRTLNAMERIVGGPQSPTMSAIRQGVWQKITQAPVGKDQPGQQKLVQGINEFLNGKGRSIAEKLYTSQERDLMKRYADTLRLTIIPKYARTNSDTAPAMFAALRKYAGAIGSALGMATHGGAEGGLSGYAVGALLDKVGDRIKGVQTSRKLSKSLEDFVPTVPKPTPRPKPSSAKTLPISLRGGPTVHTPAGLHSMLPAAADEEKKKP